MPIVVCVMCLHMKTQDYLGTIDPDAAIQMNPEDYLSDDDLAANSLHVLDCMRLFAIVFLFHNPYFTTCVGCVGRCWHACKYSAGMGAPRHRALTRSSRCPLPVQADSSARAATTLSLT